MCDGESDRHPPSNSRLFSHRCSVIGRQPPRLTPSLVGRFGNLLAACDPLRSEKWPETLPALKKTTTVPGTHSQPLIPPKKNPRAEIVSFNLVPVRVKTPLQPASSPWARDARVPARSVPPVTCEGKTIWKIHRVLPAPESCPGPGFSSFQFIPRASRFWAIPRASRTCSCVLLWHAQRRGF